MQLMEWLVEKREEETKVSDDRWNDGKWKVCGYEKIAEDRET